MFITAFFKLCVWTFLFFFSQDVRLAALDWTVKGHVTVLARPRVTHRQDAASVPQEEQGRDVKKVDITFINMIYLNPK